MADITVHHLENSRSLRVLWLLEELGLPYTLKVYPRDPKTMRAPAELRALHPLGKAPIVTVGDLVLAESGAILEYFVHSSGQLCPTDSVGLSRYRYWLHAGEGTFMPPLLVKLIIGRLRTAPLPFFIKPVVKGIADKVDANYTDPELQRDFDYVESVLRDSEYFAGADFTAADIQMIFPVQAALARGGVGDKPAMQAWVERMTGRPAYGRAEEKGGVTQIVG